MSSPEPYRTSLSPQQASFIYWLNGLAPVATNIVTPLVVFHKMSKTNVSEVVKYNQQINEIGRQFVSGTIGLLSYFGGGELTRGLLNLVFGRNQGISGNGPGTGMNEASRQIAMTVGGVIMSFIGFAFIRPLISTSLICQFLKAEGVQVSLKKHDAEAIIDGAKDSFSNLFHVDKAKSLLNAKIDQLTAQALGPSSQNRLMAYLQRKVDEHLVPEGKPDVRKTAIYSTILLSGYLSTLTGLLWGLNRILGGKTPGPSAIPALNRPYNLIRQSMPPFQGNAYQPSFPSASVMSGSIGSSGGYAYKMTQPLISPWG